MCEVSAMHRVPVCAGCVWSSKLENAQVRGLGPPLHWSPSPRLWLPEGKVWDFLSPRASLPTELRPRGALTPDFLKALLRLDVLRVRPPPSPVELPSELRSLPPGGAKWTLLDRGCPSPNCRLSWLGRRRECILTAQMATAGRGLKAG